MYVHTEYIHNIPNNKVVVVVGEGGGSAMSFLKTIYIYIYVYSSGNCILNFLSVNSFLFSLVPLYPRVGLYVRRPLLSRKSELLYAYFQFYALLR